jgi:hypothetical protein
MMIDQYAEMIEARPTPTADQYRAAARYVRHNAPDLLAMLGLDGVS